LDYSGAPRTLIANFYIKVMENAMKKLILVVLLVLLEWFPPITNAQEGAGGMFVGVKNTNIAPLNNLLGNRLESLKDNSVLIGGIGWGSVSPGILLGGEGGGFWQSSDGPNLRARLGGGYGFFDVGYMVIKHKGLRLYPMVGIGGGGITLRMAPLGVTSPTFDDVITDPKREANVTMGGLAFNFALGLECFVETKDGKEKRPGGLHFGIRAGYLFMPGKADWKLEDLDVIGGPDIRLNGYYIQAVFGGWGRRQ
jgi:hypothetical protein